MKTNKASSYLGYEIPFFEEVLSERWLAQSLSEVNPDLMLIGRQVPVFGDQKLDLLALDYLAVLWIFECKRDVAKHDAVGQLLTYGSYMVRRSRSDLEEIYFRKNRRRTLADDFRRRFDIEMPAELPGQVRLSLVSFEFSLPCLQTMDFARDFLNLEIGQLQVKCRVHNGKVNPDTVEHQWLRRPGASQNLAPTVPEPDCNFLLALDESDVPLPWKAYYDPGIMPLPKDFNPGNPVPEDAGIFLYVYDIPQEVETDPTQGLIGFATVCGLPYDLRESPGVLKRYKRRLLQSKTPCWVVPVQWFKQRDFHHDMETYFPLGLSFTVKLMNHIERLEEPGEVMECRESLGIRPAYPGQIQELIAQDPDFEMEAEESDVL